MKALILAGGFATRLRPLSCSRPKTLFPIVNKPLLQWIFERLVHDGVDEAILAVNALTQFYIRQQKPPKCGLRVHFSIDPHKSPLGTAGPIRKAEKLLGHNEPFIVLNGDIFADIDYKKLIETHKKTNALATIALCRVEDPSRFGVVELCEGDCIKRFIEKPPKGQAPSNLINAGAYVLSPEVFGLIPEGRAVSIEREIFPQIVEAGRLVGCRINGLWMDIGKPAEYLEANKLLLDSISPTISKPQTSSAEIRLPVALDQGVVLGENSVIGPYAVIGKNVKIGKNVTITNSVVFSDAEIADDVQLHGVVVGEGAYIGRHANIGYGCIIADQAKVRENIYLRDGSTVCPAKEISENIL
ncbi:NDP-sugar synthase [Candidatus Bathycorpusculum sp.]|uniref:NDP-sugar synthase n=1 Tax=Candidatus Bathycorpusculum sp. TaxID=2994959 RepID=UPI002826B390|nr:NDP-sugar synthase [Candidatus Termitimicrobium sp.]MCL2431291.1 NDP-sugar synthase [Candidatus Termitimicrobium sp.]